MSFETKFLAAMLTGAALVAPSAAWAAYDQNLVLTGPGAESINQSQLSFTTTGGQTVPVVFDEGEDEDDERFIIAFPGSGSEAGTLTYPGPDGQPRTVAVPAADPRRAIRLDVGTGTVTTVPDGLKINIGSGVPTGLGTPTFVPGLGWTNIKTPKSGYGVTGIGDPTGEAFATSLGGRIDYISYGADLLIPAGGLVIGIGGHGGSGSDRGGINIAGGGEPRGVVNIDLSQVFGSGENFGTLPMDIEGRIDARSRGFHAKVGMPLPCDNGKSSITPYGIFRYTQTRVRQQVDFSTSAFPGEVTSSIQHNLDTDTFGVGLGVFYNHFISEKFALTANLEGRVSFNNRKLDSRQSIRVFNTTDMITLQEDRNDTSFGGAAEVGATYYFTPNFGLNVFGGVDLNENFGGVSNPLSGNDVLAGETAAIYTKSNAEWRVGARVIISF